MTFYETAAQSQGFLLLLYAGVGMGVMYDLCSLLRSRTPSWAAGTLDFFWCLGSALLCFLALFWGGEDRLRPYALLGLLSGGALYYLGVRRVIRGAWRFVKARFAIGPKQEKQAQTANSFAEEKEA